ncbi:MAG TPA: AsmA family protein [Candidatus Omnitrophota bacterium]|nr:AsmA family protein [Candidatus Omnitrophota bacterium]HRZ15536.1 AsmA family protein [Candidatus Omnitrophota bacterium]
MKKLLKILGIVVLVIVLLIVGRNIIMNVAVSATVKAITGLTVHIKSMNIGLFKPELGINGLQLFNPASFPDKLMMDLPEAYVRYDLQAFSKGKVHLPEMRLNLKEFTVIKNAKGELNLDSLTAVQQQQTRKEEKPQPQAQMPAMQIDLLRLDIGTVVYKDYSRGGQPRVQTYAINIHETYKDITNPQAFVSLIVVKALGHTTIGKLADFDVKGLERGIGSTLKSATKVVGTAAADTVKGVSGTVGETLNKIFPGGT